MENVITFTRYWYLIKRTTNSAGIRANWINCVLYKVLLNLHFFLCWTYTVPSHILVRYKEAMYIYTDSHGSLIPIKIIVQFFEVKSLKEYFSMEQYQYAEGFQRFHTGLRLKCATCLSLQFFTFWVYTLWHTTLLLCSKRKSSITTPGPLTTKFISKQARLNATKSVFVCLSIAFSPNW